VHRAVNVVAIGNSFDEATWSEPPGVLIQGFCASNE